jgi:hypothetical protein
MTAQTASAVTVLLVWTSRNFGSLTTSMLRDVSAKLRPHVATSATNNQILVSGIRFQDSRIIVFLLKVFENRNDNVVPSRCI